MEDRICLGRLRTTTSRLVATSLPSAGFRGIRSTSSVAGQYVEQSARRVVAVESFDDFYEIYVEMHRDLGDSGLFNPLPIS